MYGDTHRVSGFCTPHARLGHLHADAQHVLLLTLIFARTMMKFPRVGSVPLAAATTAAAMCSWNGPWSTMAHAYFTFCFTDVLLALLVWHYVYKMDDEVTLCHLVTLDNSIAFSTCVHCEMLIIDPSHPCTYCYATLFSSGRSISYKRTDAKLVFQYFV